MGEFSLGELDPPLFPMYEQVSWMLYMITAKKHMATRMSLFPTYISFIVCKDPYKVL